MSEIKVDDLVMVVRGPSCCGAAHCLGRVFTVYEVRTDTGRCEKCRRTQINTWVMEDALGGYERSQLIKIDPPQQQTERKQTVEILA